MIDQTVTLEDFADLLADDGLPPDALEEILAVLAEIKPHAVSFLANTPELVQLAALHSPKFQALPASRQQFFASVLTMPVFFMTPQSEEEADEFMREGK
ncbi:TPA: hypothetical protein ACGAHT_004580 [Salmonella enterica subsp. enterica serovar Newport]